MAESQEIIIESFSREGSSSHQDIEINSVNSFLESCPLNGIFELFESLVPDSDYEAHVFSAITRVFLSPNGYQYLTASEKYIIQALNNKSRKKVKETVASLLSKMSHNSLATAEIILSSSILRNALLDSIANDDIKVYKYASNTILSCLKRLVSLNDETEHENEVKYVCGKAIMEETSNKAKQYSSDTIILMRYVDLLVHISIMDDILFEAALGCNALAILSDVIQMNGIDFLSVFPNSNPLLQMNAMDVIENLSHSNLHVNYLFQCGITEWLLFLITGEMAPQWAIPSNRPDDLLAPQALRIISMMFSSTYSSNSSNDKIESSAALSMDPSLVLRFLKAACKFGDDPSNETSSLAAFDAVSNFAGTSRSHLKMVLENKDLARSWLTLSSRISSKAFVLHTVAHVINPRIVDPSPELPQPPIVDSNPEFSGIPHPIDQPVHPPGGGSGAVYSLVDDDETGERLFVEFGQYNGYKSGAETMSFLLEMQRKPVSEVRHGVFDILRACASVGASWGLKFMSSCGGFFDFIENRHTEFNKEGMEWKFAVIEAILRNEFLRTVLKNEERISTLRLMLTEGPFYMPWTPDGPVAENR